ncbi:TadE/TadG family type IV pilus assembly protein [Methylobrevis albus]|uniref:Pilus assembly protein n=1 Tax=Methylobrevis albus TaxID=2793297 RepID=A0A931I3I2_9HYPH|nr:TadE/TadG family type IV pilus assembly protein [Methylobrevis albus]MBH0239582.1 pilus assembly protein [Methylobrevis albus]
MIDLLHSTLRRFRRSANGGVVLIGALVLPVLLIAVGVAVDFGFASRDRSALQIISDTTALAVASELSTANVTDAGIASVASALAEPHLKRQGLEADAVVRASLVSSGRGVTVEIEHPMRRFFGDIVGNGASSIVVLSTAIVSGNQKICVIALEETGSESIYLKSNAWLTAQDCNVYSNSSSPSGIKSDSGIKVTAKMTCSAGGFSGTGQFFGLKVPDCPPIVDPLAARPPPPTAACKAQGHRVVDKGTLSARHVLTPGTYCGGLFIGGNSVVRLDPGVYVIKDGPLVIDSNADVRGTHVGFYMQGEKTTFQFVSNAKVNIDAPKDGPMSGLLFFEDRSVSLGREHKITSNYVSNLTGTMYLSRGQLTVDATNEVAQQSAFTVIVVRRLYLSANPKLMVQSDYDSTEIPVPAGLGPASGVPILSQ